MFRLYLCCSLILMSTPLFAADHAADWYQIEMIVFEQSSKQHLNQENWPMQVDTPMQQDLIDLIDLEAAFESTLISHHPLDASQSLDSHDEITLSRDDRLAQQPFIKLPSNEMQLNLIESRLDRSNNYRILTHIAWRQPVTNAANTQAIHLTGGENFNHEIEEQTGISLNNPPPYEHEAAANPFNIRVDQTPDSLYELEGVVELSQSLYPHLLIDLILRQQPSVNTLSIRQNIDRNHPLRAPRLSSFNEENRYNSRPIIDDVQAFPFEVYRMTKSERILPDTLYYYDHPLFGVIVKITDFTPTETDLAPAPDSVPPNLNS